ncbi:riboflavin synthase [Secundilactobacillus kimchicus]|nr:riboflavin synthase [Secundilactobacillus kimchicus]
MFTGIVTAQARVVKLSRSKDGGTFLFEFDEPFHTMLGASLAINGVCLTVADATDKRIRVVVMPETVKRTTLSHLEVGQRVNVEPALLAANRLDGHFVLGHVDTAVQLLKRQPVADSAVLTFELPAQYQDYVVEKGSVTIDGVSLTVTAVTSRSFSVSLVDYTLTHTNLGDLTIGASVNLETDILGKYVVHLQKAGVSND